MEFHGVFSMELAFHGILWSIRTWSSMEYFPWNSMEKEY